MAARQVSLDMARLVIPEGHALRKVPGIALGVAALGFAASLTLALTGLGGEHALKQFYFSYLTAYVFFFTMAIGGLFFVLVNVVTRAGWSVTLRRVAEHLGGTLPWFVPLFIPIVLGMHDLYHWYDPSHHDAVLASKAAYLNPTFFIVRAVIILASLGWMGWWFRRQSVRQDELGEHEVRLGTTVTTSSRRTQKAAGPCIFVFALTVSFAAFDWLMSLEPHWYSTIFGGYFFAGSALVIMALLSLIYRWLQRSGFIGDKVVTVEHYHDLGKLTFAFIVFWGYIAFSQFMLIWYANIPEETAWFYQRYQGTWLIASRVMIFGHFLIPFFFMIIRRVKRSTPLLMLASVYLVVLHYFDMRYLVMPTLHHDGVHLSLMDLTTVLAVGGVFVFAFVKLLVSAALVPVKDPRLHEALAFENF